MIRNLSRKEEKTMESITEKEAMFLDEYIIHNSIRKACTASDVSPMDARELLNCPEIKSYIDAQRRDMLAEIGVEEKKILSEISKIAFSNIDDFIEWKSEGILTFISLKKKPPRELMSVIKSITMSKDGIPKLELHSKPDALDKLARRLNLYEEKNTLVIEYNRHKDDDDYLQRALDKYGDTLAMSKAIEIIPDSVTITEPEEIIEAETEDLSFLD